MADVIPFRGVRYNHSSQLSKLVAPPYDVISTQYGKNSTTGTPITSSG